MTFGLDLLLAQPDWAILMFGALATAGIAIVVGLAARCWWFAPRLDRFDAHAKLAELVHSSLLAFSVFVLALALTDVQASMSRADDAVSREASLIGRFDRELAARPEPEAAMARKQLRAYAGSLVTDEWPRLSEAVPSLSPQSATHLAGLWDSVRMLDGQAGVGLRGTLDRLEDFRQGRLEAATQSVPRIFWWMIAMFLFGAMVMNGRYELNGLGISLVSIHMAAIGLVIALILVLDEPFRGETSIQPTALIAGLPPL